MKTLLLYCVCGGTGVASDLLIFYALTQAGTDYQIANAVGYSAGTLISFFLNRIITFQTRDRAVLRLVLFFSVAAVGYMASALLLYVIHVHLNVDDRVAKLLTLPFVLTIQFFLNKSITFRTAGLN